MKTISINEKFSIQFICKVDEYERVYVNLKRLGFTASYEDLTKENAPQDYPMDAAIAANSVIFNVPVKGIEDAFFVKKLIQKSY